MFLFAGIKTGWDKRKEQKMPVSFVFAFTGRQAGIKRKQKMPVSLCLCTVIEIRRRTKSLDLVLCTVVYIVKPGGAIGLGKTSITIWTISSLENCGNYWGKWTILRSFRTTWVTLHDCIGGVTWQHIVPGRFLQIDYTQFDRLNLCCQLHDNFNYDQCKVQYTCPDIGKKEGKKK